MWKWGKQKGRCHRKNRLETVKGKKQTLKSDAKTRIFNKTARRNGGKKEKNDEKNRGTTGTQGTAETAKGPSKGDITQNEEQPQKRKNAKIKLTKLQMKSEDNKTANNRASWGPSG